MNESPGQLTQILRATRAGKAQAAEELLPLVYDELRRIAAAKMARETGTQTLQPTALVHEAWLRLVGKDNPKFQNRAYFFAADAEAMRRTLIENARRKRALRHGGGQQRVDLEQAEVVGANPEEELLAVDEALDKLAACDELEAEVVKLRYFVGMSREQTAEALGVSLRTADNYWAHARIWLFRELKAR
jgi:RNA polymerase sigma factor (TIGR02999 family)